MKVITHVRIDLSAEDRQKLREAKSVWNEINSLFDDNGIDVCYITDVLNKELEDLLNACDFGVGLE